MRSALIVAFLLGACGAATPAAAAPLKSGLYETLVIATAPDGRVTGYFREDQGEGVVKSCQFSITGRVNRTGTAAITAQAGDGGRALPGRLSANADGGVTLTLPGARGLPGCGLVLLPEIDGGLRLDRIAAGSWTGLVQVSAPRVVFRPGPDAPPGRAYAVRGDVLGVLSRRPGRAEVVFPSTRTRPTQGWVDAAAVTSIGS